MSNSSLARAELSKDERERYEELDGLAAEGLQKSAIALKEIRDRKLYRHKYESFAGYCRDRMERSVRTVNEMIQASEVRKQITNKVKRSSAKTADISPKTLIGLSGAAAIELSRVPPEKREAVLGVIENQGQKPTAATVKQAAAESTAPVHHIPKTPWENFNKQVEDEIIKPMRVIGRKMNQIFETDAEHKKNGHRFCHFILHIGSIGALNSLCRYIEDNLPAAVHKELPGYIPARSAKQ